MAVIKIKKQDSEQKVAKKPKNKVQEGPKIRERKRQKGKGLASKETKGGQRGKREQEEGSSVTRCIV